MTDTEKANSAAAQRRSLSALCRFLAIRITYRFMLLLLSVTGVLLTVLQRSHFAPYGIALLCLLLPSFINGSVKQQKKENRDFPLSVLYQRYHYSPVAFTTYRMTLIICMFLLFVWHKTQATALTLFGASLPLLYLALCLALYPVLSRVLFLKFHHRLMNGVL